MRTLIRTSLALLLIAAATEAYGTTLYKLTDATGAVTYTDAVPKGFRGSVKRLDIDTSDTSEKVAIVTPGSRAGEVQATVPDYAEIIRRRPPGPDEAQLRAAREQAEAARAALDHARENPGPGEVFYTKSLRNRSPVNAEGIRRFYTDEYAARLAALEQESNAAQERLEALEREAGR